MNRKLLLLDAVLVALALFAAFQLRKEWRAARAREAAALRRATRPAAPPAFAPLLPAPPVLASGYAAIADKMLFDKSRNATVVVEPAPEPPKPPMPALPVFHGLMDLGKGPIAMLSVTRDSAHQAIRPGETIGQFKLLSVNSTEMTLEWNGQEIHKLVNELTAQNSAPAAPPEAAERGPAQPAAPAAPPPPVKSGPGDMTQFGFKTCTVNDGQTEGAVVEGYKKTMHATPFGQSCTWEPVGK
jgi:hypothetical protein